MTNLSTNSSPSMDNSEPKVAVAPRDTARLANWLAIAVLAIAICLVYGRARHVPFVFDDNESVVTNTSIRSLWPLIGTEEHRGPLNPVRDLPTTARPIVNYLFALNYYFGELNQIGYHLTNFFIHFLTAVLLMAVVRRTLLLPRFGDRFRATAGSLAFVAALLWSVHPLLTDAVVYITQRTELMMAWFYLATVYCCLRYWTCCNASTEMVSVACQRNGHNREQPHPDACRKLWLILAIVACTCGMLSKEVMISAPVVMLMFDRAFVSGTFASALRRSSKLYLGLAMTWIPLFILSAYSPRSKSSGFHLCESFTNVLVYWFTQCKVFLMYLKLTIWPWPLRCAYELAHVDSPVSFLMYVVPVVLLVCLALLLLKRNHPVGFVFFFVGAILAPTSVMPILTEMAAERRMYLPLAALMSLSVVGAYVFAKRQLNLSIAEGDSVPDSLKPRMVALGTVIALAVLYSVLSAHRASDYYNETLMWQQVAESQPLNYMAHYNLGLIYYDARRVDDSLKEFQSSIDAHPRYPASRSAYGFALMKTGRMPEALSSIQAALDINPEYVPALNNMGIAFTQMGDYQKAIDYLERAIRLDPSHADAHNNLGEALLKVGRTADANEQLKIAQALRPNDPDTLYNLATAHADNSELPQAIELFERALKLRPDFAAAHNGLGIALHRSGDVLGATEHFKRFLQLRPNEAGAYGNLAIVTTGEESIRYLQKALELNPKMLPAYTVLADALVNANRSDEAVRVVQRGIEIAQSSGDQVNAAQLQNWLSRFQTGAAKR